ncbi:MAG: universal stress protein, partial [Gammaproteobacteria bacterium]|nr:universal stress protein [Gammaproteobacteria bacterium]
MKRFRKILYVAEPSVAQEAAITRAVTLAANNLAELTVIDVIPPEAADIGLPHGGQVSSDFQAAIEDRHREVLESLIEPYHQTMAIGIEVRVGKPFLETIRAVLRDGYDLVIKLAENPEFIERLFGSDDMHLLRKCPCSLWLMHPTEKPNYECIIAAIDFDSSKPETVNQGLNQQIVELATTLAISDFTELHLVHAWDAPAEMMLRMWSNNPEEAAHQYSAEVRAHHQKGMDLLQANLREQFDEEAYGY